MGIFKKIFKGIKKVVKKIGKGIKKITKKVGKAFGKLGIVGQIGLAFLMPHMMSGLGTFWKGFGGFASKLANSQGVAGQIFGKALSAVHTAGSMVGKVYTGITDTISSAFDLVTGKGTLADLKSSAQSIFSGPVDTLKASFQPQVKPMIDTSSISDTLASVQEIKIPSIQDTIESLKAPTDLASNMKSAFDSSSLLDKPITSGIQSIVEQQQVDKTLGQKIMDYGIQQKDNVVSAVKDFNLGETVVSNLTSGIESGLKQKGAELIVGERETPDANYTSINMASLMSPNAAQGIFDTVDLAVQNNIGNPYQIRAIQNYDYITSGLIQDENSWFQNRQHAMRVMGMGEAI